MQLVPQRHRSDRPRARQFRCHGIVAHQRSWRAGECHQRDVRRHADQGRGRSAGGARREVRCDRDAPDEDAHVVRAGPQSRALRHAGGAPDRARSKSGRLPVVCPHSWSRPQSRFSYGHRGRKQLMYLTKKHLPRRTVLKGLGATIALPLLDSMVPARGVFAKTAAGQAAARRRLVCIEQVHGAAGCSEFGMTQSLWNPAATGRAFDLTPSSLSPLDPFRKYLTIVSNTDARMAEAFEPAEVGGDHFRSSAVMYTHCRPKLTEGSDVKVGTSFDQ